MCSKEARETTLASVYVAIFFYSSCYILEEKSCVRILLRDVCIQTS
ncbi:hypothetical protein CP8484711_0070 [Chlamydia psittaci 84-8471/1]|nr:hypothetical protein B600_0034 [Chlamydia psittaci VS225]EPP36621.1 hypothetical protein CP8484711_0070 [Chlamydia psittaci 84-8471/1]